MKKVRCIGCKNKFKPLTIEFNNLILSPKNCDNCRTKNQRNLNTITEPVCNNFLDHLHDDYEPDEDRVIDYYYKIVL